MKEVQGYNVWFVNDFAELSDVFEVLEKEWNEIFEKPFICINIEITIKTVVDMSNMWKGSARGFGFNSINLHDSEFHEWWWVVDISDIT